MNENQEIFRRALNLTLAIYRLTERFPEREFLTWQLRRLSDEIMGDLKADDFGGAKNKIELLLIYFKIGRAQKWVLDINWQVLNTEFQSLDKEIVGLDGRGGQARKSVFEPFREKGQIDSGMMSHNIRRGLKSQSQTLQSHDLSERQRKIIDEIRNRASVKMADLVPLFRNQASERTIRNDLQVLLGEGLINKRGSHRSTTYFSKQ